MTLCFDIQDNTSKKLGQLTIHCDAMHSAQADKWFLGERTP